MAGKKEAVVVKKEVKRLLEKYDEIDFNELVKIAKEEYGVSDVIETPLVFLTKTVNKDGKFYIFYDPASEKNFALAYEIGHLAMGNYDDLPKKPHLPKKLKADYFSVLINNVPLYEFFYKGVFDNVKMFNRKKLPVKKKHSEKEIKKLKKIGAWEVFNS